MDLQLVPLDEPAETREFEKGRFELYRVGSMTLGRASYEPGWRWSEHVGAATGARWCEVGHDSWVVGDEPYVSLHIMGSEDYAAAE